MCDVLFESANLRVVSRREFGSPAVVITFASFSDDPTLDQPGFGEGFLARRRIDAVHVICGSNRWYQYPEMDRAMGAVAAATAGYGTRVAYGSSMGAYAAINFAKQHRATRVIAISPQFSVDAAKLPWEDRWIATTRSLRFVCDDMDLAGCTAEIFAIYDPRNRDGRHVALIRQRAAVRDVPVPFGGHPAVGMLAEAGLMTGTVTDLIEGRFDPAAFAARLRAARRSTPAYFVGLSEALSPRKGRLKAALAAYAAQLRPGNAAYRLYHGTVLIANGDWRGAERVIREAQALAPHYSPVYRQLRVALEQQGRIAEAIEAGREAVRTAERDAPTLAGLGRVLLKGKRTLAELEEAVHVLRRSLATDPDQRFATYHLSIALAGLGRLDEAIETARAATRLAPGRWYLHRYLGWLHVRRAVRRAASLVRVRTPA